MFSNHVKTANNRANFNSNYYAVAHVQNALSYNPDTVYFLSSQFALQSALAFVSSPARKPQTNVRLDRAQFLLGGLGFTVQGLGYGKIKAARDVLGGSGYL